jgi:MerR family transcriptional regulator, light-induced transcriptional regulator
MISIGAVSHATGIPVDTLRTWERRYGFPVPARTEGGHRTYPASVIEHLKLIHAAIARGHRPLNVVGASPDTLRTLLDLSDTAALTPPAPPAAPSVEEGAPGEAILSAVLEEWMRATLHMDAEALQRGFERCWFRLGPITFLHTLVGPFLEEVGHAWYEGRIAVLHEQFASIQLRQFLSGHWRPLSERARGPRVICATLPGEFHAIGLHMTSVVMALAGCQIVFLGCDTPLATIAAAAAERGVNATLISVSAATNTAHAREQLLDLLERLPPDHSLLVGGAGAPEDIERTTWIASLPELERWARRVCMTP